MKNQSTLKRLLVLALVILAVLAIAVPAFAQEGEAAPVEHAAEAPATNPLTPLGINTGFLAAQCINFLLIFGLLSVVLWRPMMNMLDSRGNKIAKGLEDAAAAASARQNAEAEAEKILASARLESNRVIEEAAARVMKWPSRCRQMRPTKRARSATRPAPVPVRSATVSWPTCAVRWHRFPPP